MPSAELAEKSTHLSTHGGHLMFRRKCPACAATFENNSLSLTRTFVSPIFTPCLCVPRKMKAVVADLSTDPADGAFTDFGQTPDPNGDYIISTDTPPGNQPIFLTWGGIKCFTITPTDDTPAFTIASGVGVYFYVDLGIDLDGSLPTGSGTANIYAVAFGLLGTWVQRSPNFDDGFIGEVVGTVALTEAERQAYYNDPTNPSAYPKPFCKNGWCNGVNWSFTLHNGATPPSDPHGDYLPGTITVTSCPDGEPTTSCTAHPEKKFCITTFECAASHTGTGWGEWSAVSTVKSTLAAFSQPTEIIISVTTTFDASDSTQGPCKLRFNHVDGPAPTDSSDCPPSTFTPPTPGSGFKCFVIHDVSTPCGSCPDNKCDYYTFLYDSGDVILDSSSIADNPDGVDCPDTCDGGWNVIGGTPYRTIYVCHGSGEPTPPDPPEDEEGM